MPPRASSVRTPSLEIGYEESGPAAGPAVILLHGFPDDVRAWDGVAGALAAEGCRVLVPYLRGYGPTRFVDPGAPRMAQQAAIGQDLLDFMDVLGLERVSLAGYNVQNTLRPSHPAPPEEERAYWYQWYFNTERGRAGLETNRRDLCRLLWRDWSPGWRFDEATFERTAAAFDNPDFVPVVIHSYRHRHLNAPGDPRLDPIERRLAERPRIEVPSVILHGRDDGVDRPRRSESHVVLFPEGTPRHVVPDVGHFMPREQPGAVVDALRSLLARTR